MLTQEELKQILEYDPTTGDFIWKISPAKNVKIGDTAGTTVKNGYCNIKINRFTYKAHRLAWLYMYREFPDGLIDHINGVADDNRIVNLRVVSNADNSKNQKIRKTNTSGYKGVSWSKTKLKWQAQCCTDYKAVHLGYFDTPKEASEAYNNYAREHHKEFYRDTTI